MVWLIYLFSSGSKSFHNATRTLRHYISKICTIGLGNLVPLLLLVLIMSDIVSGDSIRNKLIAITGLSMIFGGIMKKIIIILRADNLRGIEMDVQIFNKHNSSFDGISS